MGMSAWWRGPVDVPLHRCTMGCTRRWRSTHIKNPAGCPVASSGAGFHETLACPSASCVLGRGWMHKNRLRVRGLCFAVGGLVGSRGVRGLEDRISTFFSVRACCFSYTRRKGPVSSAPPRGYGVLSGSWVPGLGVGMRESHWQASVGLPREVLIRIREKHSLAESIFGSGEEDGSLSVSTWPGSVMACCVSRSRARAYFSRRPLGCWRRRRLRGCVVVIFQG